jgi:antitoxin HicB
MQTAYPVKLTSQDDGSHLVTFPDVPEALTEGSTPIEALDEAMDCLLAALGGYILEDRELPEPSAPGDNQTLLYLPILTAAKAVLYQTMVRSGLTRTTLAQRLALTETRIADLVDLDSPCDLAQIETALAAMGKRLVVDVANAA